MREIKIEKSYSLFVHDSRSETDRFHLRSHTGESMGISEKVANTLADAIVNRPEDEAFDFVDNWFKENF